MTGSSYYSVEKDTLGKSGGTTQSETRIYNERLALSLIRLHGQLTKVELTRLTGLAPQTITTIVNRAADRRLVIRGEPRRGGLGQPSVPYALNPEGAYSFGLKIDHCSADIALVDFVGHVIAFERTYFDYPMPAAVMAFANSTIKKMLAEHTHVHKDLVAGLGIASPFQQRNWMELIGVPPSVEEEWKRLDIRVALEADMGWPTFLLSDAMVSAGAELMFGSGLGRANFLYAFIGEVVGGGVVLDHHLFPGGNKRAGDLGEFPVSSSKTGTGATLNRVASIRALRQHLNDRSNLNSLQLKDDWADLGESVTEWSETVSESFACLSRSIVALMDIDNLIIDGAIPTEVRSQIAKAVRRSLANDFADRPEPFSVLEGTFGDKAPSIGGASIPLIVKFSNDKELLFKE